MLCSYRYNEYGFACRGATDEAQSVMGVNADNTDVFAAIFRLQRPEGACYAWSKW